MGGYKDIIVQLLIFIAVLVAAYFTAKYFSKRSLKAARSRHMRVTDRLPLSRDKTVYLVKVGDEHYLLGATNQQISVLGKPEIEEDEDAGDRKHGSSFAAFMAKAAHKTAPEQEDWRAAPDGAGEKKGFSLKKARDAWQDMLRKKRENEEALRAYRKDHKQRKEEDE
ncbi:MAG: flagellar biosynthetic protein FliO [Bacillota bacterium]